MFFLFFLADRLSFYVVQFPRKSTSPYNVRESGKLKMAALYQKWKLKIAIYQATKASSVARSLKISNVDLG